MTLITQTAWLLWKDLLIEARKRESVLLMFFFGVMLLFIFNFAFEITPEKAPTMAPGLLWIGFVFTGSLGLTQLFQPEKESACLDALLLSPVDRAALYCSKVLFNLLLMLLTELVVLPLFGILFNLDFWMVLPKLLLIIFLGTLGFCVVGTLFSAITLKAKAKELLLPFIIFPLMIPVILSTIRGMETVLQTGNLDEALPWLRLLLGFDVIFFTSGLLVFDRVIDA